jgi:ABC-type transport system involved in cytochrome bd biosynthesis fused ATPase/permease subunit
MRDLFSGLPDKTSRLQRYIDTSTDYGFGWGQMQRLDVARTFMCSSSAEQGVGLPSLDELTASLDPTAERGTITLRRYLFRDISIQTVLLLR